MSLAPNSRGFATIFLTSLDGQPLSTSTRLLLTIPGATMGTGTTGPQRLEPIGLGGVWQTIAPGHGDSPSASLYQVPGPTQMERVAATVSIETAAKRATVTTLDVRGAPLLSRDAPSADGHVSFNVNHIEQPFATSYEIVLKR